jgi:hypothetical protein
MEFVTPIRVHIESRFPRGDIKESAKPMSFWSPYLAEQGRPIVPDTIIRVEAELERGLGQSLRKALVEHFAAADGFRLRRELGPSLEDARILRGAREKVALASRVMFHVRIVEYGSLNLDVSAAPLDVVARLFDFDVAAFEVFLGAFVPDAFGSVFSVGFSDQHRFDVTVPPGVAAAFQAPPTAPDTARPAPDANPASPPPSDQQRKMELLWRLANGSLVMPVALALFVMWYGLKLLSEIQQAQLGAMTSLVEHQTTLLKEDRERFALVRRADSVSQAGAPRR